MAEENIFASKGYEEVKDPQKKQWWMELSTLHYFKPLMISIFFLLFFLGIFLVLRGDIQIEDLLNPQTISQGWIITQNTRSANTLEVPALFPDAEWEDITERTIGPSINQVMSSGEKSILVPIQKGRYLYAEITGKYSPALVDYYKSNLTERKWIVDGGALEFKTYKLISPSTQSLCNGVVGFIGYMDGMMRYVSISYNSSPCQMPGDSSIREETEVYTDYKMFVSDITPLDEITKYINEH